MKEHITITFPTQIGDAGLDAAEEAIRERFGDDQAEDIITALYEPKGPSGITATVIGATVIAVLEVELPD